MSGPVTADRRLHPGTMLVRMFKDLPSTLLGLPAFLAVVTDVEWTIIVPTAAAAVAATLLIAWLAWRSFRYGIGAHELVIESGILSRTRRSIPFARIQDVDIERGVVHRLLALARVRIETGGSASDEGLLDSVTLEEANRLRSAVRAGRDAGAAPDAAALQPEPRILYAMDVQRVLLSGLFGFSFLYLAFLFAVLQAMEPFLPFDIYDPGRWLGIVGGSAEQWSAGAIGSLLLLALLLGLVTGVARALSRDFRFRLVGEAARLRRERGLFTRSEVVIPKARIQLALRKTGPVRRHLGWYALVFQTLAAGKGDAGQQSVAPFAREEEVAQVLAELPRYRLPQLSELRIVSSGYVWRKILPSIIIPAAAITVATLFFLPAAALYLLLAPLAAMPLIERRLHRYGVEDGLLFVARGVWKQKLWAIPLDNAQAVSLSRSWLQRRLGTATVHVDTAGAPVLDAPSVADLKLAEARVLARTILDHSGRKSGTDR